MGQQGSKERDLFVQMLTLLLKPDGCHVRTLQLECFLQYIQEICPWFLEEGTVNLATWERVGQCLQNHTVHGPSKVPTETLSLWSLLRDCLYSTHEQEKAPLVVAGVAGTADKQGENEKKGIKPLPKKSRDGEPLQEYQRELEKEEEGKCGKEKGRELDISESEIDSEDDSEDIGKIRPMDALTLAPPLPIAASVQPSAPSYPPREPQGASRKHRRAPVSERDIFISDPWRSPLQQALDQARDLGETMSGFARFPVVMRRDSQGNVVHEPLPFKTLKELKLACAQYGPTAPFTLNLLDTIGEEALPPHDWKAIARACLSGGDYLLWKCEFYERAAEQAERLQQVAITADMLTGEGQYAPMVAQLEYQPATYLQISQIATQVWRRLPATGTKTEKLSNIRQGPEELFQEFVSRLQQTDQPP
ncbi:endogenous retrovirus group K member 7 Gag polyprotein-like isoform X2 [Saccopteryx leptura]|uniref:endogenous retrovirus group K member 7 Gag polyprotein-like isoform X2 n=1 Tax=Saccopteryx leptura TaxID=249018 RepID=UPI00339D2016